MSDDIVKQSIDELREIVRCTCHHSYTIRGMHDPTCECDSAEAVQVVTDHIEALEAKLALVVALAEDAIESMESGPFQPAAEGKRLRATLAKIQERDDD